jgi:hypothetical protein
MASGDPVLASDAPRLVARTTRVTSSTAATTTEIPVTRIDDIPVFAGKAYMILTSNINLDASVANDIGDVRLRVKQGSVTGGQAAITDTEIGHMRTGQQSISLSNMLPLMQMYYPSSDGYLSILISVIRVSGTGNFAILDATGENFNVTVWESDDPGDTGVQL